MKKFEKAKLPTREDAVKEAEIREGWATHARDIDKLGSAHEFELTALLLRFYAEH